MKQIIIIFCLILASCNILNQDPRNRPISTSWVINSQYTWAIVKNITWTGELIFSECEKWNGANSLHWVEKLSSVIEQYWNSLHYTNNPNHPLHKVSTGSSWWYWFGRFIGEYCKTKNKQYIFYSWDKMSPTFWRYDENLDKLEESHFIKKYFNNVWWFNEFWAFWKRIWNVINIHSETPYPSDQILPALKKISNQRYCDNWLTSWGKKAQCFYRVNYEFDFIKNTFTEKNICSFYRDDLNKEQILEPCFEVKY